MTPLMNWRRILLGVLTNCEGTDGNSFPVKERRGKRSMVEAGKGLKAGVPQALCKTLGRPLKLTSAFAQLPPGCLRVPPLSVCRSNSHSPARSRPGRAG